MMSLTAQASLLLAELGWRSKPLATIGVTSCHRREGVSTIAQAIAGAAAPSGVSVLLANIGELQESPDQPLRRPKPAPNEEDASATEFGKPTSVDGLFVTGRDAASRQAMAQGTAEHDIEPFLERLRNAFGLCVFDLPPILEDGRGAAIAARLDSTVIVIEAGRTSVSDLRRTERVLASNGAKVAGAILNRYRD
jgi:Mrp family chromosome partitioning ATPase